MLKESPDIKRVIIRTGKTDLRLGIDKLANLVQMQYGLDPLERGTLFLFCGNRRDRIKGLLYEDGGYLMVTKRLSHGIFQWPRNVTEAREMLHEDYCRLLDGYEVETFEKAFKRL